MKRTDLRDLLAGLVDPGVISDRYSSELDAYSRQLSVRGASAAVILEGEDSLFIDADCARRLLHQYLAGKISTELLRYVLDAISLDEQIEFRPPGLIEQLRDLSDSEISAASAREFLKEDI